MPHSFAESPDGLLYFASGMDPVMRWDGRSNFAETAGVEGPSAAPSLTGSGNGAIVGTYRAYVRFLDQYENPSNLSPVSDEYDANGATGTITGATNAVPIVVTSATHGLTTGATVKITGVEGTDSANATWTITVVDADSFSLDGSAGNGTYRGAGEWVRGVGTIEYSSLPTTSDPKVVKRQVLRNTDGQSTVYYVDIETTDLAATALTSTKTDDDLLNSDSVALFDDDGVTDLAISRYTIPPADRKYLVNMLGRMFGAGVVRYSQGAVIVTFGSATVTGIGTEFTASMEGRYIAVDGAPKVYLIDSVDVSTQAITLSETYLGATDPYATYAIEPVSTRRRALDYSEAFLSEAWPPTNSLDLEADSQSNEVTGLLRHDSFLYVLHRKKIRRLTYQSNPSPVGGDGGIYNAASRGSVNQRCALLVTDIAGMLDDEGVHLFAGPDDIPVSDAIRALFDVNDNENPSIQWRYSENFHAVYDSGNQVMRWFVCLDGGRYPRHALALDYLERRWWIEEYYRPIASSCVGQIDGRPQVFLGTNAAQVLAFGAGELDGPNPQAGTTRGTPTSVGLTWLEDSTATFATDLVNAPVHIVDGTGRGQWRTIVAVSGTRLTLNAPWLTLPTTSSTYQIGGIAWTWKSGTFRFAPSEASVPRRVNTVSKPTEHAALMSLRILLDRATSGKKWGKSVGTTAGEGVKTSAGQEYADIDLTKDDGFHQIRFDSSAPRQAERPRFIEIELAGVKGRDPIIIYELSLDGGDQ